MQRKYINIIKKKKCRYCHSTEDLTIDHKIPIIKGGTNDKSNLQCLCRRCNEMKSKLTDGEVMGYFRWFLKIQENRQNKKYSLKNQKPQ